MKLRKDDKVVVITGRDKGKTGKIVAVFPKTETVVVEGINMFKRHTKPSNKNPRGGILDITKPIGISKLMVLDPATGKPARIGYEVNKSGVKERIFKVSAAVANAKPKKAAKPAADKTEKKAETKATAKPAEDKK
jgi:large subunit ribosomal protein L24